MTKTPMIRPVTISDAGQIAEIYNFYVQNTVITFEEESLSSDEIEGRIEKLAAANLPWLVAQWHGRVVGYAYVTEWKARAAYRYSVEISIYLEDGLSIKGLGTSLYEALFSRLEAQSIHSVLAGIALPNPASIGLHEKFGMSKVAELKEVGFKLGRWVDVGYWQIVLHDSSGK